MTQSAQKLEDLLARVQRNRNRPRSEVVPAPVAAAPISAAPARRSKSPIKSQSPLEMAVEHQLDTAPIALTEPSPPPRPEPSPPPPSAPERIAATPIEAAPAQRSSGPVARAVGPAPELDAPSFGELLARSLALRP